MEPLQSSASPLGFSHMDQWRCHDCAVMSHGAAGTELKQLALMSQDAHLQPSLLGCLLSSSPEGSNLQLLPLLAPGQHQDVAAEQPLAHSAEARANEQTHKGGLLAPQGERKGGGTCCQLVCMHLGWHFQPCNCCIMNLAMEFESYDSFRPKKHESAPKES